FPGTRRPIEMAGAVAPASEFRRRALAEWGTISDNLPRGGPGRARRLSPAARFDPRLTTIPRGCPVATVADQTPQTKDKRPNSSAFKVVPETRDLRDRVRAAAADCGR